MRIAIISPTREEGKLLTKYMKMVKGHPFALYKGKTKRNNIYHIISGIGKTNAASATTYTINKFSPDIVILSGIGGAYPSRGVSIGDVVIAEKEFYGDEGIVMKDGYCSLEITGIPILKKGKKIYFNEFGLDKRLVNIVKRNNSQIKSGNFVTLSAITGTKERAIELSERFNAICENMEGAAVAHTCLVFGKRLIEIRGISNIVEDRDRSKWDIKKGIENCSEALLEILNEIL